jgi:hypothetical protein
MAQSVNQMSKMSQEGARSPRKRGAPDNHETENTPSSPSKRSASDNYREDTIEEVPTIATVAIDTDTTTKPSTSMIPMLGGFAFSKSDFSNYTIKELILDFFMHDLFKSSTWTGNSREKKRCDEVMESISLYIHHVVQSGVLLNYPALSNTYVRKPKDKSLAEADITLMKTRITDRYSQEYTDWHYRLIDLTTLIAHNYLLQFKKVEEDLLDAYNKHNGIEPSSKTRAKKENMSGIEGRLQLLKSYAGLKENRDKAVPRSHIPEIAMRFLDPSMMASISSSSSSSSSSSLNMQDFSSEF